MTKIPDDVVERALAIILERKKYKRSDLTLEEYEYAMDELRAAGEVFVAWEREQIKRQIDARMNSHLLDMQPNYDDSITGFNEAWDQMRDVFRARSAPEKE